MLKHNFVFIIACSDIWMANDRPIGAWAPSMLADNTLLVNLLVGGSKEQYVKTNDWKYTSTGVTLYYSFTPMQLPIRRIIEARVSMSASPNNCNGSEFIVISIPQAYNYLPLQ